MKHPAAPSKNTLRGLLLIATLLSGAVGCRPAGDANPAPGCSEPMFETRSIQVQGSTRSYILYTPSCLNSSSATPLLMFFHGYNSNASQQVNFTRLDQTAEKNNFILVFADSVAGSWSLVRPTNPDVTYTEAVLNEVRNRFKIDSNRIYAAGHSNGAQFVYRLLELKSDVFAAFGVFAGCSFTYPVVQSVTPGRKAAMAFIHGTADAIFSWEANTIPLSSRRGARDALATAYGCPATPTSKGAYEVFEGCADGAEVLSYVVPNMTHAQWPTAQSSQPAAGASIDGNDLLWSFLKAHPR